jgi:putative photosynthetic complex assembly protein 2
VSPSGYGFPVLYALLVWWFATGVVLLLDGLPKRTFRWSLLGATVLLCAALYGLWWSAADASVLGAYCAFSCSIVVWGWQELSFLTGYVTGPRRHGCREGCTGWHHFGHAVQAILYHEFAILMLAILVAAATWGEPNQVGMWTFAILWIMRISAKFNLFLGVRNTGSEFLPPHLAYLESYFRRRPMNWLFPFVITAASMVFVLLVRSAMLPDTGNFERVGTTLLAALLGLAILEHWFLVLPLPVAALWSFSLRVRDKALTTT